jgi:hypothetical protein
MLKVEQLLGLHRLVALAQFNAAKQPGLGGVAAAQPAVVWT